MVPALRELRAVVRQWAVLSPRERLAVSANIFGCHNSGELLQLVGRGQDAAEHPHMYRAGPSARKDPTQNVSRARPDSHGQRLWGHPSFSWDVSLKAADLCG